MVRSGSASHYIASQLNLNSVVCLTGKLIFDAFSKNSPVIKWNFHCVF